MDHTFYTCPYCKEEYTHPSDLAHCILSCEDKKKREEEDRKKAELALTKENRKKEIEDALEHWRKLMRAYLEDYGALSISKNVINDFEPFFANRPWHWWL